MQLRSRVLAEVKPASGNESGTPGAPVTEGSGELVTVSVMSHSSTTGVVAGASMA